MKEVLKSEEIFKLVKIDQYYKKCASNAQNFLGLSYAQFKNLTGIKFLGYIVYGLYGNDILEPNICY